MMNHRTGGGTGKSSLPPQLRDLLPSAASNETIHLPRAGKGTGASLKRAVRNLALLEQLVARILCDLAAPGTGTVRKQSGRPPCNCPDRREDILERHCVPLSGYQDSEAMDPCEVEISSGVLGRVKKDFSLIQARGTCLSERGSTQC